MIRFAVLALCLAAPAQSTAQDIVLPDVEEFRSSGVFDLDTVPPLVVQQAIAASEDRDYFETFPAFSPISQAVVRNFLLGNTRSLTRKAMEIRLAVDLANAFTPEEIMTMYAQKAYLGANCFGFEDALNIRLGVALEDASIADALALATLLKSPMAYESRPDQYQSRFRFLALEGALAGFWSEDDAEALILAGPTEILPDVSCQTE